MSKKELTMKIIKYLKLIHKEYISECVEHTEMNKL